MAQHMIKAVYYPHNTSSRGYYASDANQQRGRYAPPECINPCSGKDYRSLSTLLSLQSDITRTCDDQKGHNRVNL